MPRNDLTVVPATLQQANEFVQRVHRHHGKVQGHKFSLAAVDTEGKVRAVAIVGRPVSRVLDDGWTLEITRLASDGAANACSFLYAAAWRTARALGYRKSEDSQLPRKDPLGGKRQGADAKPHLH